MKKIFFTSLLTTALAFAFQANAADIPCGTVGSPEGLCVSSSSCSNSGITDQMNVCLSSEVCCKKSDISNATSTGSSCTDGSKTGTCEDSSSCKTKITDRDGKCPGQVCCTEKITSSGSSCTDGSKTGTCEDSSSCKTKITDRDGKCPGQVCCTEKITSSSKYCEDHSSEGYFIIERSKNCSDTEGATDATEYTAMSSDYKCCKKSSSGGGSGGTSGIDGIDLPSSSETGLTDRSILEIVSTVLGWLLKIFLLLATIAFVVTGLQFLFALGNSYSDAATNAKKNFSYSIIALVVVGAGYIIILTIDMLLKG